MKADLRRRMRAVRGQLDPARLELDGHAVAERVLALPEVAAARSILCYVSVRREVPTRQLLATLNDRVCIPRVIDADHMEARAWQEPLVPGVLGIPTSDGPLVHAVDVVLCPGLAFDTQGHRLGYGAGYYDRFLNAHPAALCIGLCVDEAVLDEVPSDEHDHPMAMLVTPTRTIHCGGPMVRVVAAAWIRDGRVLAAKRGPGQARAGLWELPGGKVERGEDDATALRRELAEELGVQIDVGPRLGHSEHAYDDVTVRLIAYQVSCSEQPVPAEHAQLRWLAPSELGEVEWAPADVPLIAAVTAALAP